MKPGLSVGDVRTLEVVVTEAMSPGHNHWLIEGVKQHVVHPLYGTAAMLTHMEWTARQHLLPYLEAGEEAAGTAVEIRHRAPAPVAATVRIQSTLSGIQVRGEHTELTSTLEAWLLGEDKEILKTIGRATFTQVVLPTRLLYASIEKMPLHPSASAAGATLCCVQSSNRFQLVLNGLAHPFPCTRYDEWVNTRAVLNSGAESIQEEGPFLLRYEIQELITALGAVAAGKQPVYQSDFLEQVLQVSAASAPEAGFTTITIQLKPVGSSPHPEMRLVVSPAELTPFCHALEAQYLAGTELPASPG